MKKIRFRVWDNKLKEWEYYILPQDAGYMAGRFTKKNDKEKRFEKETLMQYTGLKDTNGKEIFEGDILEFKQYTHSKDKNKIHKWTKEVKFETEKVGVYGYANFTGFNTTDFDVEHEIIGNRFENPELIK